MARLSKTTYCYGVQCPKMLWLSLHKPEVFDPSVLNENALQNGSEVGDLAMGLFGEYREVPCDTNDPANLANMLNTTAVWLEAGEKIICEASFSFDGCFCSVDILRNLGKGIVELYEVKSSTHEKEIYHDDIAYQVYVLTGCGYRVARACLIRLNTNYVRQGELDIHQLFAVEDLTGMVCAKQGEVKSRVVALKAALDSGMEPKDGIGEHCTVPYQCGFWTYCTRALGKPNVFSLAGVQGPTKWDLYRSGLITFEQLERSGELGDKPLQQVEHALHDMPDAVNAPKIAEFLGTLSYPLYFLDFETFNPAVPLYDGTHAYQQVPFQYSLHYIESEGRDLMHKEYLAWPGEDPRRGVAEALCRDIPRDVCVTAYNMSFEKSVILGLAKQYPDLAGHLMAIHDNIRDLIVPFRQRWYYNRAMQGSYSIKYVLPALWPNDPALDYHSLEGVHNGAEASYSFKEMASMDREQLLTCREQLLKYCGLDTYAMVKVWEKLSDAAGRPLKRKY